MKKIDRLTSAAHKNLTSSTDSSIEVGQKAERRPYSNEHIDAINTVFTQFEVAFPNLYQRAFTSDNAIMLAKQLWANSLQDLTPKQILNAVKKAIESSDYIPTIHAVLKHCREDLSAYGLPSARDAYIEASNAIEPRARFPWSHPAVYFAGRQSEWFFLASNSEHTAFPVFEKHYQALCERVISGETLAMPDVPQLESDALKPMTSEDKLKRMADLRKEIGL
jgi:hypothetical protein